MTKGFQDSVLDLKTHSYWSLLFKVALGVKKSCYKAILLNVHPRPAKNVSLHCLYSLFGKCGHQLVGVHNMQKTPRWRLQFHEKPATPNVSRTAATSTQSNGAPPRMAPFPLPARPLSLRDRFGRGRRWIKEHLPLNLQTSESLSPKDLFPILTSALTDNSNDQPFWCIQS